MDFGGSGILVRKGRVKKEWVVIGGASVSNLLVVGCGSGVLVELGYIGVNGGGGSTMVAS